RLDRRQRAGQRNHGGQGRQLEVDAVVGIGACIHRFQRGTQGSGSGVGGTGHNEVEGGGGGRDQQAGNQDGNAAGLGSGQGRFLSRGSIPCNEPAARRATSAERCGIIR